MGSLKVSLEMLLISTLNIMYFGVIRQKIRKLYKVSTSELGFGSHTRFHNLELWLAYKVSTSEFGFGSRTRFQYRN